MFSRHFLSIRFIKRRCHTMAIRTLRDSIQSVVIVLFLEVPTAGVVRFVSRIRRGRRNCIVKYVLNWFYGICFKFLGWGSPERASKHIRLHGSFLFRDVANTSSRCVNEVHMKKLNTLINIFRSIGSCWWDTCQFDQHDKACVQTWHICCPARSQITKAAVGDVRFTKWVLY